jgi:hypothetical protein
MKEKRMNDFACGMEDARLDVIDGWVPCDEHLTLDYIVSQLRVMCGSSDAYVAGYLSVIYNPTGGKVMPLL